MPFILDNVTRISKLITTICAIYIICVKDINSLSVKELLISQMEQMAQILLYRTA